MSSQERVRLTLTWLEAQAILSALDTDIHLRLEAARDEFGHLIPDETIADEVPAQRRAQKKIRAALDDSLKPTKTRSSTPNP